MYFNLTFLSLTRIIALHNKGKEGQCNPLWVGGLETFLFFLTLFFTSFINFFLYAVYVFVFHVSWYFKIDFFLNLQWLVSIGGSCMLKETCSLVAAGLFRVCMAFWWTPGIKGLELYYDVISFLKIVIKWNKNNVCKKRDFFGVK